MQVDYTLTLLFRMKVPRIRGDEGSKWIIAINMYYYVILHHYWPPNDTISVTTRVSNTIRLVQFKLQLTM